MMTITLQSQQRQLSGQRRKPLLDELRAQGVDLPYGCQYGGCITCAAKLMTAKLTNAGRWLSTTGRSTTVCDPVRGAGQIGLYAGDWRRKHDRLYRNPFLDPLAHELKLISQHRWILTNDPSKP